MAVWRQLVISRLATRSVSFSHRFHDIRDSQYQNSFTLCNENLHLTVTSWVGSEMVLYHSVRWVFFAITAPLNGLAVVISLYSAPKPDIKESVNILKPKYMYYLSTKEAFPTLIRRKPSCLACCTPSSATSEDKVRQINCMHN